MYLEEWEWSRCCWMFPLYASLGIKRAANLSAGGILFFLNTSNLTIYGKKTAPTGALQRVIKLPKHCTKEALEYIANECPILKVLDVGLYNSSIKHIIPKFVSKWKSLERMRIGKFHVKSVLRLLPQIGLHCNNFIWLSAPYSYIRKDEALGIVASLPKLKYLDLHGADFEKEAVVMILQGCKQLVHLDIRDCRGFRGDDAEILELASHIPSFMCEGSSIGLGELSAFVYNREVAREVEHELFCDKICHDDCVYAFHFDFDDLLI